MNTTRQISNKIVHVNTKAELEILRNFREKLKKATYKDIKKRTIDTISKKEM